MVHVLMITPLHACKPSRNWMTPAALLGAACRVLRGEQGERAMWFPDLCKRPLRKLLPALLRLHMYTAEPAAFAQLACNPQTHAQLRFARSSLHLAVRHPMGLDLPVL